MYLAYGSYQHDSDTNTFTINSSTTEDEAGNPYETTHNWSIEGQIQGTDTADVVTKFRALELAYSVWYRDLVFYTDAGVATHRLLNAGSVSGVRIVSPPSYPRGDGAQLSTFRDYTIVASATYPASTSANAIRSYTESVSFSGGGPERAVIECVNVPPQEQILKAFTTIVARQSGSAVGMFGYPPIPPPLFPGKERIRGAVPGNPQYGSPKLRNGVYVDFPVSWNYEFISGTPLFNFPNRWPVG